MREILFRGKTISTNQLVYGGYFKLNSRTFIVTTCENDYKTYEVHPNSVAQYTGQVDHAGDRIFEGDIVHSIKDHEYADVAWFEETSKFILNFDGWLSDFDHFYGHELEVSGNTFDEGWFESNG